MKSLSLRSLEKRGCRFSLAGDHLTINNIPDWPTYRYCREHRDKLVLQAVTEDVFRADDMVERIEYHKSLAKCSHCKWKGGSRCPFGKNIHKIPPGRFQAGCERWVESSSIYF